MNGIGNNQDGFRQGEWGEGRGEEGETEDEKMMKNGLGREKKERGRERTRKAVRLCRT
jgi:hypothetical protein